MVFTNVCRGLFEAHKLIFSFLIASSINKQSKKIEETVWSLFLRGCGVYESPEPVPNPDPAIFNEATWDFVQYISKNLPKFEGFDQHVSKNWVFWQKYITSEDPYLEQPPSPYQELFDNFDKLMLIKIFRPEKLMFGFSNYVEDNIGKFYLEIPQINMNQIYEDSDVSTPIIFVLSSGADPTQ